MSHQLASGSRRQFLQHGLLTASGLAIHSQLPAALAQADAADRFQISLHQYSLKPLLDAGRVDLLDYGRFVKDAWGIKNVEFAAEFCESLLAAPEKAEAVRASSEKAGVRHRVFLCAAGSALDSANPAARAEALQEHLRWADVAERLGCEHIRVRATTEGDLNDQLGHAAAGVGALCSALESRKLSVLIENITGPSSNPDWLVDLAERIGTKRVGLLADFGNFAGDAYAGMKRLLPHTKSVCTKSWNFDEGGNETKIDYGRMMEIILASPFRGCIAIESLGDDPVGGVGKAAALVRRFAPAA